MRSFVRIRFSPVHPADLHVQRGRFGRQPEQKIEALETNDLMTLSA